jgi:hypothetical protein
VIASRNYDSLLGKDNFAADREMGDRLVPPGVAEARQWHPGWSDLPAGPFRDGQAIAGVARVTG